jgi:FkbH-like protein
LREIALEDFKYLRALIGKQKKCLVLDCDDVLWGGVIGEEGLAGIKLGQGYPGSPYRELQQEILNLHHRGVILALCSRNNEADVWEVFRSHPDMLLREEDIAASRINWADKPTNLIEIAAELNIGLDSLLFVDDSQAECELVRRALPEIGVLHLPRDSASGHRQRLATGGWFDAPTISDDDRQRGARYQAEGARTTLRAQSFDLESYFESLEMVAEIRRANRLTIPRVAQLTQKTNQFNLTTLRCSEEEVARLAASDRHDVLTLRLADRFGDSGLVGAAVLSFEGTSVVLSAFLLSCRVLGRGVEDAFLVKCLARAKSRGALTAIGEFRPTAKNHLVRDFYRSRGFRPVSGPDGHDGFDRFELDLGAYAGLAPRFFKRIDAAFGNSDRREE